MPCSGNASHNLASRRTQGSANGSVRGRGVMGRHRNAKKGGRSPRGAGVGGSKALCQGTHLRPLVIYWASAAPAHARLPGANDQHYPSTQIPISVFFLLATISHFDFRLRDCNQGPSDTQKCVYPIRSGCSNWPTRKVTCIYAGHRGMAHRDKWRRSDLCVKNSLTTDLIYRTVAAVISACCLT